MTTISFRYDMITNTAKFDIPKYIRESCLFKKGDVVILLDGDGRRHTIKELLWTHGLRDNTYHASVIFEDNSARASIDYYYGIWYEDIIKVIQ